MICDKCGNDAGKFSVTRPDGEKWCVKCVRALKKRPSKTAPTKDPDVKIFRKLASYREGFPWSEMYASNATAKRKCFTNGHLLLSHFDKVPLSAKHYGVRSLEHINNGSYPAVDRIINGFKSVNFATIPEEFYTYAKAFKGAKFGDLLVEIGTGYISIDDDKTGTIMKLTDVETTLAGDSPITLDYYYVMTLKPKRIAIGNSPIAPIQIRSSYDAVVNSFNHVMLARRLKKKFAEV